MKIILCRQTLFFIPTMGKNASTSFESSTRPNTTEMASQWQSPFQRGILKGDVALVTGGGSGIGLEISRQLGLHGASVVLMGRREAVLTKAVEGLSKEGISARWVRGDVRSQEDAQKAVAAATQSFGKLNILVNCAAGNFLAVAEMLSSKGFRTVLDIDTVGTFTMCGACFPALKAAGGGIIINISAVLHHGATWYQAHASAAKAAIDSLTRSLALEWGEFKIRVCGIAPGPTDGTPGLTKLAPGVDSDSVREIVEGVIPLGRLGTRGDMALAAVFLASPAGSFITGDTLAVDGGQRLFKEKMIPREVVAEVAKAVEKKARQNSEGQRSRL